MKFSNYFNKDFIFIGIKGDSKQEIIENMIESISLKDNVIKDRKEEITKIILKRENEISTAIGMGIGIPHGRIADYNDIVVAVGILEKPFKIQIEGSKQDDMLKIVFLIISDALKNKTVLKLMSSISKIALKQMDLLENLKNSKTPKEVIKIIEEAKIEFEQKITAIDLLSPELVPVTEDTTLNIVANRLIIEKISGLPVVNKNNNFLGEITERELIGFGMPQYTTIIDSLDFLTSEEPFEKYLLKEDITTIEKIYRKKSDLSIVDGMTSIMEVCHRFVHDGITRIYVVDDNKYVGTIKRGDIIKKVLHL